VNRKMEVPVNLDCRVLFVVVIVAAVLIIVLNV
jgi:hypothetical protein